MLSRISLVAPGLRCFFFLAGLLSIHHPSSVSLRDRAKSVLRSSLFKGLFFRLHLHLPAEVVPDAGARNEDSSNRFPLSGEGFFSSPSPASSLISDNFDDPL